MTHILRHKLRHFFNNSLVGGARLVTLLTMQLNIATFSQIILSIRFNWRLSAAVR